MSAETEQERVQAAWLDYWEADENTHNYKYDTKRAFSAGWQARASEESGPYTRLLHAAQQFFAKHSSKGDWHRRKKELQTAMLEASGPLAQSAEHPAHNRECLGSIPRRPTNYLPSEESEVAKSLSDLLCPPHANLDKGGALEPFDNCIACIRVQRDELHAGLDGRNAQLAMTVARLGGIVEDNPTGEHNFLQRIDELREIEAREESEVRALLREALEKLKYGGADWNDAPWVARAEQALEEKE